jgi:hypothetical protein
VVCDDGEVSWILICKYFEAACTTNKENSAVWTHFLHLLAWQWYSKHYFRVLEANSRKRITF